MKVKIKKAHADVPTPKYMTNGSSGCDVCAAEKGTIPPGATMVVSTGIFLEVPEGYECQIRPRSGLAARHSVTVLNSPGTLDSDYRGELKIILHNAGPNAFEFYAGDRVAQLVFAPVVIAEFEDVDVLEESDRNMLGLGSTGVK